MTMLNLSPCLSWPGLVGAAATVFVTTLDDAIWLLSYTSFAKFSAVGCICHGLLFVFTLEALSMASVAVAILLKRTSQAWTHEQQEEQEVLWGILAASLCWILALFFYVKKWLKKRRRRRRQQKQQQEEHQKEAKAMEHEEQALLLAAQQPLPQEKSYESPNTQDNDEDTNQDNHDESSPTNPQPISCSSVLTVMSLTTLGALDEVSYFPALVLGGIFSWLELCLGTLVAACFILAIVTTCLQQCQPMADCLDRIPLYGVIALFATVLTIGVIYDVLTADQSGDNDDGNWQD